MTIDFSGDFPKNRKSCERFAPDCKQKLQFRKKSIVSKPQKHRELVMCARQTASAS